MTPWTRVDGAEPGLSVIMLMLSVIMTPDFWIFIMSLIPELDTYLTQQRGTGESRESVAHIPALLWLADELPQNPSLILKIMFGLDQQFPNLLDPRDTEGMQELLGEVNSSG